MRTTLDVDEDVLLAAKEQARRERRSAGAVLSELARKGLTASQKADQAASFFGFTPLPKRGGVASNELINQLRDEDDA